MKKIENKTAVIIAVCAVIIALIVALYFIISHTKETTTPNEEPFVLTTITLNLPEEDKANVDLVTTPVTISFTTGQTVVCDDWQENVLLPTGKTTYTIQSMYLSFNVLSATVDIDSEHNTLVLDCYLPTLTISNSIQLTNEGASQVERETTEGTKQLMTITIDKSTIVDLHAEGYLYDYNNNETIKLDEFASELFSNFIALEVPLDQLTITQPSEPVYNYKFQLVLTDGYIRYTSNLIDIHCYISADGQCYISAPSAVLNIQNKEVKKWNFGKAYTAV